MAAMPALWAGVVPSRLVATDFGVLEVRVGGTACKPFDGISEVVLLFDKRILSERGLSKSASSEAAE